jgi:hypothetical protein
LTEAIFAPFLAEVDKEKRGGWLGSSTERAGETSS